MWKFVAGAVVVLLGAVGVWYFIAFGDSDAKTKAKKSFSDERISMKSGKGSSSPYSRLSRDPRDAIPRARRSASSGGSGGGFSASRFGNDPTASFEENELVVTNAPKDFMRKAGEDGVIVTEVVRLKNLGMDIYRVSPPRGMDMNAFVKLLRRKFPGALIEKNHHFDAQVGAANNARSAIGWEKMPQTCGKGVRLGMIDSSVDMKHSALKTQDIVFKSFTKPGRKAADAKHGTAIAAMLVGTPEWGGLLPSAKLFAANMFEINESGKRVGSAVGLLKAVDWMSGKNVRAVNLSVAGSNNKVVRVAFKKATKKGLILVAAAGNWGRKDKPAYPAAYKDVMAVTALKGRELIYTNANQGSYIDFAAPGVRLWTAAPGGGGKNQSGTSFATPFIAVHIALRVAKGATHDPAALKASLKKLAVDLGKPGKDTVFGWGRIDKMPKCN